MPYGLSTIDVLYDRAKTTFNALATLLSTDDYFSGTRKPGMLDAAVFAYTHLVLDEELGLGNGELRRIVMDIGELVKHRKRVYKYCFGNI